MHFPSQIRQLRIRNNLLTFGALTIHISESPGTQHDFKIIRPCQGADGKGNEILDPGDLCQFSYLLIHIYVVCGHTSNTLLRCRCLTVGMAQKVLVQKLFIGKIGHFVIY